MEIGDTVIFKYDGWFDLTKGKKYKINQIKNKKNGVLYAIYDDGGSNVWVIESFFLTITEIRKLKLNKIWKWKK